MLKRLFIICYIQAGLFAVEHVQVQEADSLSTLRLYIKPFSLRKLIVSNSILQPDTPHGHHPGFIYRYHQPLVVHWAVVFHQHDKWCMCLFSSLSVLPSSWTWLSYGWYGWTVSCYKQVIIEPKWANWLDVTFELVNDTNVPLPNNSEPKRCKTIFRKNCFSYS